MFKSKKNDKFDVNLIIESRLDGYISEVDTKYPDKLNGLHNDYQSVPEKLEIIHDMLLQYCYGIEIGGVNKLVPKLGNKSKYALH